MLTVSYFSAGVSSAVATKLMISEIDRIMYTHIDDQHPDSLRFVKDCEIWFGKQIEIMQSPLRSVDNACRSAAFLKTRSGGAVCTDRLKRRVRKTFENENRVSMRIVWGLDSNEQDRAERLQESMPYHEHVFPLIDAGYSKKTAHQILKASGIKRPYMYDLGYNNNNCIGCIKGGMAYWNKIRKDFPEVFSSRAALERLLGFSIIKGVFLDELDPWRGYGAKPIVDDCGIMCEIMALDAAGRGEE